MKNSIYLILEKPTSHRFGKWMNLFIFFLVVMSTISLYLSSVKDLKSYSAIFDLIELIAMVFFTIELILRFIVIGEDEKYKGFYGRLKYCLHPFIIIDLLVVIPYYLLFFGIDLIFLRVLRLLRIFKLFRHTQYDKFDDILLEIFKENRSKFVVVLNISTILIIFTAPVIYYLEKAVQPEVFSSMPAALWWTVITFTTVGYGDMYPVTALGRVLSTIISVLGISFYAIPGAIFTSALLNKINTQDGCKQTNKDK